MQLNYAQRIALNLYSGLWWLAHPLLQKHKRLRGTIAQRLVPNDWASPADIWLQAASGGEAYLAWEVLKALPLADADTGCIRLLVTTWTEQGLEILKNMQGHLAYARPDLHVQIAYFPFDERPLMQQALRMVRPKVMALLETELWPSLLAACAEKNIPVCLLNGRMTKKSLRHYRFINRFTSLWQSLAPTKIMAMSQADGERFAELFEQDRNAEGGNKFLGQSIVSVAPNIKFDRAKPALAKSNTTNPLKALLPEEPAILLASVREEEESLLMPIIQDLYDKHPNATLIIAPRHMHRVKAWQDHCKSCPNICLRSSLSPEKPAKQGSLIIWDTFGELNLLYAYAKAVFVGGSLAKLGGQNILEPLAAGKIPCTGPHLDNFLWALDFESSTSLLDAGLIIVCPDATAVYDALHTAMLKEEAQGTPLHTEIHLEQTEHDVQHRFTAWLATRLGGTKRNALLLHDMLCTQTTGTIKS